MGKPWKILLVEDHTLLREGIRAMLSRFDEFVIAGEAADGIEAIRKVAITQPDLLLMDLSMPKMNGMEAMREIKQRFAGVKIIALTVHKAEEYLLEALRAGADGYVLKDASQDELLMAVRTVIGGQPYLSPGISASVIAGYLDGKKQDAATPLDVLTKREREVLKLVAEGYKNRETAEILGVSIKTVEKHRTSLMKKLDLHNAAALTALAVRCGLVVPRA
jgi:DNA-binding NarL/FixJ family response regulator